MIRNNEVNLATSVNWDNFRLYEKTTYLTQYNLEVLDNFPTFENVDKISYRAQSKVSIDGKPDKPTDGYGYCV